jgi:hypothetical protein
MPPVYEPDSRPDAILAWGNPPIERLPRSKPGKTE